MADVIHRTTLEFKRSVNEVDHPEPEWKHNPDMSAVSGVPQRYWKAPPDWDAVGAGPVEMTQPEKDAVDAVSDAALVSENRTVAQSVPENVEEPEGWSSRALIELFNKRDNYLVNRIAELQSSLAGMKAASNASQMRDAIPATFLATNTRTRPDAILDYDTIIANGEADT